MNYGLIKMLYMIGKLTYLLLHRCCTDSPKVIVTCHTFLLISDLESDDALKIFVKSTDLTELLALLKEVLH